MDAQVLLTALSDPAAFPDGGRDVRIVQTHVSMVFLTGDRAYKVKKTLALWGFLDYSTLDLRRHYCEEEVRLNLRLAPEVYLGVTPVVRRGGRLAVGGEGEVVDWAVVMRRLADDATLLGRIRAGRATASDAEEVGRLLARFHAAGDRGPEVAWHGRPRAFAHVLRQNFHSTREAIPSLFPRALHEDLARRVAARFVAARRTLARRHAEGRVVEAHGDLRAEHAVVVETPRGPEWRVIDAIEFTPMLRCLDPLADVGFLAMDLAYLGRRDLARAFLDAYFEAAPDADAPALLPLYLAYRAHVRAKVDMHRAAEAEVPADVRAADRSGARRHLALAWAYARQGSAPPLVVLAGPSGTGKSAVARSLASILDAEVLASDRVRKELAGLRPTDRPSGAAVEALYAPDASRRTYATLLARAEAAWRAGRAVVLDATYLRAAWRREAADLARRLGAPYALAWLDAPDAVVRERLAARAARGDDPSDATWEVFVRQRAEAEPPGPDESARVVRVDGSGDPSEAVLPICDLLAQA